MQPITIEITENVFDVPSVDHDVLRVTAGDSSSESGVGMITQVDVPATGVLLEFLTGGGKHCSQSIFVKTKAQAPTPLPPRPAPSPKQPKPTAEPTKPADEPSSTISTLSKPGDDKSVPADVQPLE